MESAPFQTPHWRQFQIAENHYFYCRRHAHSSMKLRAYLDLVRALTGFLQSLNGRMALAEVRRIFEKRVTVDGRQSRIVSLEPLVFSFGLPSRPEQDELLNVSRPGAAAVS